MANVELHDLLIHVFSWIGDRGTTAHGADRTKWLREPRIVQQIGSALAAPFDEVPTLVIGPATSGYGLGALVAAATDAGFAGANVFLRIATLGWQPRPRSITKVAT